MVNISTNEAAFYPAIITPSMDDVSVHIKPPRDDYGADWIRSVAISNDTKLEGTIWQGSSNMIVYVGPNIAVFRFGVDHVISSICQKQRARKNT